MSLFRSTDTSNQTEFSHMTPILDTGLEEALAAKVEQEQALKPKVVWFKRPKVIALIFVIVLLLIIAVSALISSMTPQTQVSQPPAPSPTPVLYQPDLTLIEKINLVKKDLEKLDFQEANLALPQIDRDISITIKR